MSQARTESVPTWTLGWRLQRSLSFAELSVQDMADELGVSRGTISRWCNDHGAPSRGYLKLWALRTGVPLEWLTEGDSGHRPVGIRSDVTPPLSRANIHAFRKKLPIHSLGKAASKALGANAWTAHTLRHRFATRGYAGTRDLFAGQAALGHSTPETTKRYTDVPADAMLAFVQAAGS